MLGHRLLPLLLLTALTLTGSNPDSVRAREKLERIANDQAEPGSVITFTSAELIAYATEEMSARDVRGIRALKLGFGDGTAVGSALVDFSQLKQLESLSSNWLLASLLKGEKPVTVDVRVESGGGTATIIVQKVKLADTEFEGGMLDFLVESLLRASYPDAKIGEPFELGHNVKEIQLVPSSAKVTIAD